MYTFLIKGWDESARVPVLGEASHTEVWTLSADEHRKRARQAADPAEKALHLALADARIEVNRAYELPLSVRNGYAFSGGTSHTVLTSDEHFAKALQATDLNEAVLHLKISAQTHGDEVRAKKAIPTDIWYKHVLSIVFLPFFIFVIGLFITHTPLETALLDGWIFMIAVSFFPVVIILVSIPLLLFPSLYRRIPREGSGHWLVASLLAQGLNLLCTLLLVAFVATLPV